MAILRCVLHAKRCWLARHTTRELARDTCPGQIDHACRAMQTHTKQPARVHLLFAEVMLKLSIIGRTNAHAYRRRLVSSLGPKFRVPLIFFHLFLGMPCMPILRGGMMESEMGTLDRALSIGWNAKIQGEGKCVPPSLL